MASTYRVVIELIEVYTDGSEEVLHSALCCDAENKSVAEETMMELTAHAETY